ncbi:Mu transposase C-terminal domain-containing protein [Microbacterium sp. AGC62]
MPRRRDYIIGQTIELIDGTYTLIGCQGILLKLRNELTDETALLHYVELFRMLAPGQQLEVVHETESDKRKAKREARERARAVADVIDDLDADTRLLIPHLRELVDGTPAVGTEPRAQYETRLPMSWRLESKMTELEEVFGMPIPLRTLQRRLSQFRKDGVAGLGDKRKRGRKEAPFTRADEDVVAQLRRVLKSFEGRSQTSYAVIRAELKDLLEEEFPHPNDRPATPSISTIERYVKMLSGDQNPTKSAQQRQTAALVPKHTFRKRAVTAPGDECQTDSTRFDAFVLMPDGRIVRPWLTTLMDKRTRSIIGFHFTDGPARSDDHAWLIARTLVPHALRPWSKQYAELELPEMPWAAHVRGRKHNYDTFRPYIFPRRILTDNGQDFRGIVVQATCSRYGIHLTETPPRTPTGKPHVEKHFDTIKKLFTRHLPGYVGGSKAERGVRPEMEAVLELRTVIELFDEWLGIVWQNRAHEGLSDPFEPKLMHSPNSMYAASLEFTGHFTIPLGEEDYIAMMPRVMRTVQADGILIDYRKYNSPHLAPMRLQKDENDNSIEVAVHYDRNDPSQVWVRSSFDGEWITCEWVEDGGLLRPNERQMLTKAKHVAKSTKRFTNEDAHDLALRMRKSAAVSERTRREQEVADAKVATRKAQRAQSQLTSHRDRRDAISDYLNFDEVPFA